jgi:hypothetical protein
MAHHSCTCCCAHDNAQTKNMPEKAGFFKEYWRILLSSVILFSGIALSMANTEFFKNGTVTFVWYSLAYLPVGLPVLKEAWESILQKDIFSEFTLMSVATLGAFYIREYPEGVAVMLFYSLGELFQNKAVSRAKRNIGALLDVRPETATVIRDNAAVTESPRNVQVGEIIEVKTGERIPLDGKMLGEAASFNTSALTGESVPRTIRKGEEVLAGMIATDKVVRVEVTKPFEKSALSRILELVQNASERKAPAELFIRTYLYTDCNRARPIDSAVALPLFIDECTVHIRFQRLAVPGACVPGYLMSLRSGGKYSFGILRRHRRCIPLGHTVQRRELPGCHNRNQYGGIRQDRYADPRHIRGAVLPYAPRHIRRKTGTNHRFHRTQQYASHSKSHYKLCRTKADTACFSNGHYGNRRSWP